MSDLTKANFSPEATSCRKTPFQLTLPAGETIAAGDAVRVKSTGEFWLSDGSADDGDNNFYGIAANGGSAGDSITAFGAGAKFNYGASLTPGTLLYISGTDGKLADAVTTGDHTPVAMVITSTQIQVLQSFCQAPADLS